MDTKPALGESIALDYTMFFLVPEQVVREHLDPEGDLSDAKLRDALNDAVCEEDGPNALPWLRTWSAGHDSRAWRWEGR